MRRLAVTLILELVISGVLSGTYASADCIARGDTASCGGSKKTSEPGAPGGGGHGSGGGNGPETVLDPRVVTGPDGQPCVIGVPVPVDPTNPQGDRDFARELWEEFLTDGHLCPNQPGLPAVDPRVLAIGFWQDIPLPKPAPSIAPGWGITGKAAYLETHGERQHEYARDTPFGPLTLAATGRYHVDWGDGETTGPYDVEGGAWPDGQITHTYINTGHYNLVVTEEWTSTWHLGDESGDLDGLATEGTLDNFRVEQIQAVVGSG